MHSYLKVIYHVFDSQIKDVTCSCLFHCLEYQYILFLICFDIFDFFEQYHEVSDPRCIVIQCGVTHINDSMFIKNLAVT